MTTQHITDVPPSECPRCIERLAEEDALERLHAAAPALLEAAEAALMMWQSHSAAVDPEEVAEMLGAAIAAAKGEQS